MSDKPPLTANERALFRLVLSVLIQTRANSDVLLETNMIENQTRLVAALQKHQALLQPQLDSLADPQGPNLEEFLRDFEGTIQ